MTDPAPRPHGRHTVTPRVFVADPEALTGFLRDVFGAEATPEPGRPTDVRIGDSWLIVSGTEERDPAPAFCYVYVADTDATYARALAHGAVSVEEPSLQVYGDRRAMVRDPYGCTWQIATYGGDAG